MARKLSASALTTFLKSPRAYYWRYISKLEPVGLSVATFDHDKIAGTLWSEFVARFYAGASEESNTKATMASWLEQTDGWVPEKAKDKLTKALEAWGRAYYQMFSPDDGCRTQSEVFLENERFLGYLDGLNTDGIVHEVKSTSRSPILSGQLWKVQNSIQVKLYAVLAQANGVCIEFAFKDSPYQLFRGPIVDVTPEQRKGWKQELDKLADYIYSLGDDMHNYPCNPDSCCLVTKGITSMCSYEALCSDDGLNDINSIAYKVRQTNRNKQR